MKAFGTFEAVSPEHPDSVVELDLPLPRPEERDLVVKVRAVSVNPVDCKMRCRIAGRLEQPLVYGWDASGTVVETGSRVSMFKAGDEIYYAGDITRFGCCSEYHLVDERIAALKPKTLNFEEAAAVPLTAITAWESIFDRLGAGKQQGTPLLIIGGAGGVGSIAVQIAKQAAGLTVIATASRHETKSWCRSLGADLVLDHSRPLTEEFSKHGLDTVPYIFCVNHTELYLETMNALISPQGHICAIAAAAEEASDINQFRQKSVTFSWEFMFTRPMFKTPDMIEQHRLLTRCAEMIDTGMIRHTMTGSYGPLTAENLRRAHAKIESQTAIGKITLFFP